MLPMLAVRLQLGNLLAADPTTLAPASHANEIALIIAPFTPNENLAIGDLTLANSNGLSPIPLAVGTQPDGVNPVTGQQQINLPAAAAPGLLWTTTGSFPPTITVYGYALVTNGAAELLAVQSIPSPISFDAPGQILDLDPATIVFDLQPMT